MRIDVSEDEERDAWLEWNRRRTAMENHTSRKIAGSLGALLGKLLSELDELDRLTADTPLRLETVIDQHSPALRSTVRTRLRATFLHFGELTREAADEHESLRKQAPENATAFERAAIRFAESRSAELVTQVNAVTKRFTRGLVSEALSEGWGSDKLAQKLRESNTFKRVRSNRIARTETTMAANRGQLQAAAENADVIAGKKWVAAQDGRTRDSHSAAHGQVVSREAAFTVGGVSMDHPGDPSAPPREVVNCRCMVTFETE